MCSDFIFLLYNILKSLKSGDLMKKTLFLLYLLVSVTIFFGKNYITQDFSGIINNRFNFEFTLEDVYNAKINYSVSLLKNDIKVSGINDIIGYIDFSQPGFEITYRKTHKLKDAYFFTSNFDNFNVNIDDFILINLKDINVAVYSQNDDFYFTYWINIFDIKDSRYIFGYDTDKISFSLELGSNGRYIYAGNRNFMVKFKTVNKFKIFSYNKNYSFVVDTETGSLSINSDYFEYNSGNFYYRFPVNNYLYLTLTNYGPGLSFIIPI